MKPFDEWLKECTEPRISKTRIVHTIANDFEDWEMETDLNAFIESLTQIRDMYPDNTQELSLEWVFNSGRNESPTVQILINVKNDETDEEYAHRMRYSYRSMLDQEVRKKNQEALEMAKEKSLLRQLMKKYPGEVL